MAEILGVGCTHRPLMLRPNEDWTFMLRAALDDPAMPEEMKNPANWPAPLRAELATIGAPRRRRAVARSTAPHFAEARRSTRRIRARADRDVGRRPVRELQGRHHPALRGARLRGPGPAALDAPPEPVEPVERAGRQEFPGARPQGGRQIPGLGADRSRDRCRLCVQAAAPPDRPRVREHGAAARRRAPRLRLSAGPVRGQLLRAAGQCRARAAPAAGDEGRDQEPRPARAQPAPLHGGRRRCGARHGREPVAHRVCRLVEPHGRTRS